MSYCSQCGEPRCFCGGGARPSISWNNRDGSDALVESENAFDRLMGAGAEGPWIANEDGLWCPHCGDIIAPIWFFERDEEYEPPSACRCGFPEFGA